MLSDGWFWISGHNTHTETESQSAPVQSTPVLVTITAIVSADHQPHDQTDLLPHVEEKGPLTRAGVSQHFIRRGNQILRRERGIPQPR